MPSCKIRRNKLPDPAADWAMQGSFFKNPEIPVAQVRGPESHATPPYLATPPPRGTVKVPAGWLIEQAGWKGRRFGAVGVHERQALVLVNYGGGTGDEIRQLAERVQASVEEKFGIRLSAEVNFV